MFPLNFWGLIIREITLIIIYWEFILVLNLFREEL